MLLCAAVATLLACGKKGPPLPPLVKLPVAPADFTVRRQGDSVELQFTVPAANTDNSHPANIQRVDVYGVTADPMVSDADVLKYGTRVGNVDVKAPRDPEDTAESGDDTEVEEPTGKGLDQGARAQVDEDLSADALKPVSMAHGRSKAGATADGPLPGFSASVPSRTYLSVGVSTRGRRGALSKRVAVPLLPIPSPPSAPRVTYDEKAVSVAWTAPEVAETSGLLPSRSLGSALPTFGFNVYEVGGSSEASKDQAPSTGSASTPTRLNVTPITGAEFSDPRMTWGAKRCYAVRVVETLGTATIESDPGPETCVKLVDTFPPAAPRQLTAVASEGAISLIWEPNSEPDLAGYLVLRGPSLDALSPITPAPIAETTFRDEVPAGTHYFYVVRAVDKAGNKSDSSNTVDETAR